MTAFPNTIWNSTASGGGGAEGGAADGADAGDAEVDPLDLLGGVVAEAVAVEALVGVVEGGGGGLGEGAVHGAVGDRDPDLERLAEVAQVGRAQEPLVGDVEPLRGQGGRGLALELPVDVGERLEVELGVLGDERADVVDADVDGQ